MACCIVAAFLVAVLRIVRPRQPARGRMPPDPDKSAFVDEVVRTNAVAVEAALVQRSQIIRDAVDAGRTRVVPAVYDLESGRVSWL